MGWLDRLLGRRKEQAQESPAEKERSDVDLAEERAAAARDESLEAEGRVPPGST